MQARPSPYIFGAMSLGADEARIEDHIRVARRAMELGLWFHASLTYHRGFSFMALRCAFDEAPSQRPPLMLKIRDASPRWLRFECEDCCRRLGIDGIDVAQLVGQDRQGPDHLIAQLQRGSGPVLDELASLRQRGLIRQAVLYMDPDTSEAAVAAARGSELINGLTGYWNLWQDPCTPAAWQALREAQLPLIAIRTLAGATERPPALAAEAQAIAEAAGHGSQLQLALDLVASEDRVLASVGGTGSIAHLEELATAAKQAKALAPKLLTRITALRQASQAQR
ncbi:MAG: hypothetical protein EA402_09455 [Planctomycetota bacterium]|nr:MAG: hypothetical protein EA402_09455 [Planctomycetota bacterium]